MTSRDRVWVGLVFALSACREEPKPDPPPVKSEPTVKSEPAVKSEPTVKAAETPADAAATKTAAEVELGMVLALDSAEHRGVQWKHVADELYESIGEPSRRLRFMMHAFTRSGTAYRFVMWGFDDAPGDVNAALLAGTGAEWKPAWAKRPFIEADEAPDEVVLPQTIPLDAGRLLVVDSPSSGIGCGAEDCPEEDDHVDNTFFEITPDGAAAVLQLRAPSCTREEDRHPVAPAQCLVRAEPNAAAPAPDLVVTLTGKKPRTLRYEYRDGKYVPTK